MQTLVQHCLSFETRWLAGVLVYPCRFSGQKPKKYTLEIELITEPPADAIARKRQHVSPGLMQQCHVFAQSDPARDPPLAAIQENPNVPGGALPLHHRETRTQQA
ncbi:MAG: hypothetical protein VB142_10175 [Burkholderia sp.]